MQYPSVYCTLTLHHIIKWPWNIPNWACNIERTVVNKNSGGCWNVPMLEWCYKYGLIKFTYIYQINHYFSTKALFVTGSILNWGVVRLPILHTLARDAVSSFSEEFKINLTENSCKWTEKYFSYIIKELLNWYWWILALVGFKMHSQARAFLQSTHAKIHQYQLNNPVIFIRLMLTFFFAMFSWKEGNFGINHKLSAKISCYSIS